MHPGKSPRVESLAFFPELSLNDQQKKQTSHQPGEAKFGCSSVEPAAVSCAGEERRRKSLRGGKPQGIHHTALSRAAPSWPWFKGPMGLGQDTWGNPASPREAATGEPPSPVVWTLREFFAAGPVLGPRQEPEEFF